MNASIQHNNDPVVRSSLGKAGVVIANALSSPRRVGGGWNQHERVIVLARLDWPLCVFLVSFNAAFSVIYWRDPCCPV